VEETKTKLGTMGMGRRIESLEADRCVLREEWTPYNAVIVPKIERLSLENGYFGDYNSMYSVT